MRYWYRDASKGEVAFAIFCVALSIFTPFAAYKAEEQWRDFAKLHKCKLVAEARGQSTTGTVIGSNGQVGFVSASTSPTKTYLCDNGVQYTR